MRKIIENLNNELVGTELNFMELDNILESNNFYSVLDDGIIKDIKNDLNVVYSSKETNAAELIINFEITSNNGVDEIEESFLLKVLSIENI